MFFFNFATSKNIFFFFRDNFKIQASHMFLLKKITTKSLINLKKHIV